MYEDRDDLDGAAGTTMKSFSDMKISDMKILASDLLKGLKIKPLSPAGAGFAADVFDKREKSEVDGKVSREEGLEEKHFRRSQSLPNLSRRVAATASLHLVSLYLNLYRKKFCFISR